jgi:serine/threonine protein kinase
VSLLKIDRYKILRQLGSGGSAEVYLAEDTVLRRKVALKILHKKMTEDAQQVERFRSEAEWMSMLSHPNLLTIFEVGEADGVHFIASEFVEGETLRQKLSHGPLTLRNALEIAIDVASALRVAHEMWIVHRDVKPENILIHPEGFVKVLDFGVAKLTQPLSAKKPITLPRMVVGTLQYLAPEQIRGEAVDPRTDLWALGAVLFESITGEAPFTSSNVAELFVAITTGEVPRVEERGVAAPPQLDKILRRLLAKTPEERPESAAVVIAELKDLLEEVVYLERSRKHV